ncbi:hypothetical protein MKW92_022667 [Papaver armeniacum]|nr:hypothetical protein MKW92_022667 [Papaver armeniacum]
MILYSTKNVNLLNIEGQFNVGGTIAYVSVAILMVLFKGQLYSETMSITCWMFISSLVATILTKFYTGMLCLIGNFFCMAAYLSFGLSLTARSYFFGAMFMVIAGISSTDGNIVCPLTRSELAAILYVVSTSHWLY